MVTTSNCSISLLQVTHLGSVGGHEEIYYSTKYNQVYIHDTLYDNVTTLTHEEYINLCDMREKIESLAKNNKPS